MHAECEYTNEAFHKAKTQFARFLPFNTFNLISYGKASSKKYTWN